jgi:protein-S-isoprenylcysteine O-methyltransferase Ste14
LNLLTEATPGGRFSIALFVVALVSFAIYGYAIKKVFSREHGVDRRMKLLQVLGSIFALVHLLYLWHSDSQSYSIHVAASFFYATALATFFAAIRALKGYRLTLAFSPDAPKTLIDQGIYGYIRHPFYLAYSLTWIGGAVAAPSLVTAGSTLIMVVFYVSADRVEERKFLSTELASSYELYRNRTGML